MALDSFRQLILDAQAMMDPDFAGKLSADVAEADAEAADTDFSFGAAEPTREEQQDVVAALEAATDFTFGGNENQIPLLDPSHFSPFAEKPIVAHSCKCRSRQRNLKSGCPRSRF